jgi:DNA polymerase elongation subunit (family B)
LDDKYRDLPEYDYNEITYNNLDGTPADPCIFVRKKDGTVGLIPEILKDLIAARGAARKQSEIEKDPFKKKVLDGLQIAYKVVCNSVYGQTGSPVSPICMKEIAGCTAATGRRMLKYSEKFVEEIYGTLINLSVDSKSKEFIKYAKQEFKNTPESNFIGKFDNITKKDEYIMKLYETLNNIINGYHVEPKIIYGDTDSVFFILNIKSDETGEYLTDDKALDMTIKLGVIASKVICTLLPPPMKQEYEKTLWPLIILSKKRYVGNLYEKDPKKFFQKSMGIVLKRRDNAQIVKIVCANIIDQIINKRDPMGAVRKTKEILYNILANKYSIDKYVITKTLKQNYKKRASIAHAVLADRMKERDAGSAPMSNDRIPYVFVVTNETKNAQFTRKGKMRGKILLGNRIEHIDYVIKNKLDIDKLFYITNQIEKPAVQFLKLIIHEPEKIFEHYITIERNRMNNVKPISAYTDV